MQTVRVFISSTFTDFSLERNILHNSVFSRIRKLCARHGCEFQAVDLRWGITELDSRDYATLDICLEEVRQCQRVTPRPNFIFLSGSKYGWRPLPRRIPCALFQALLRSLGEDGDAKLLTRAYRQDRNAADEAYVFVGLPGGTDEAAIRGLLRKAADTQPLSAEDQALLFASATHLELLERLSLPDFAGSAICAVRTLKNVPAEKTPLFYDTLPDGAADGASRREAEEMGRKAEALCLDTWRYELDLAAPEKTLEDFAEFVYAKMEKHILSELEKANASALADEVTYHREAAAGHARFFRGRERALREAEAVIVDETASLLIARGAVACGKTAFMARLAALAEQRGRRVHYRSVGLTGNSADIGRLTEELKQEAAEDGNIPPGQRVIFLDGIEKARNPRAFLRAALKLSGEDTRMVLSMTDDFARQAEEFLPKGCPVITLEPLTRAEIGEILTAFLTGHQRHLTAAQSDCLIRAYDFTTNMHVFRALMNQALKWRSFDAALLPDEALRRLADAVERGSANLPPKLASRLRLYLAAAREGLTAAELLGALSRDREVLEEFLRLSEHLLPGTEGIIAESLAKNGLNPGGNEGMIRWLHGAKDLSGLLDALLASGADISLPYVYFSRALYDFMPALSEKLSQGQRVYVIEKGLCDLPGRRDGDKMKACHSLLADYFAFSEDADLKGRLVRMVLADMGIAGPSRLAVELPWQYLRAERYDDLYRFLCDPERLVFLDRWDRAELASLWTQLQEHGDYRMEKGYASLLGQAKALAEGGGEIGALTRLSAEALIALLGSRGGYHQEIEWLNGALLRLTAGGDADLYLQSKAQKAMTMMDAGRFREALAYTEGLMRETQVAVTPGCCDLLYAYGVALFRLERYPEAEQAISRGYELARRLGEEKRIRNLLKWKASCAKVMGKADEAERIYRELEEQYEQHEDKHALIATYYERASHVFLFEGNPEKAFGLLDTAARYARETGQRVWLMQIYNLAMNMLSVRRDYPCLKSYSLKYLETWAEVNPGQKPRDPEIINFLIAVTKTEPTAENLFMMESCMLLLACGPIRGEDPRIRDHPYRSSLLYLACVCLTYQPEEIRRIAERIPPAPHVFAEAFDRGVEKACEKMSESSRESFQRFLRVFDDVAGKALRGESLGEVEGSDGMIGGEKILRMRTTMGILLLYWGFDPISKVYASSGAQQAQFTVQVHMLLFQANYTAFRSTMSYNEYRLRIQNHNRESALFDRYRQEADEAQGAESDVVKSLLKKFSQQ